ncbi:MAG: hypothetical protein JNM19_03295 [Chitinophagaceae bacterium]|nr:hypothetical protein [Chitinophagaceae bacterium]
MLLLILLIRFLLWRRKSIPVALYAEALRNENKGDYQAAVENYETALQAVTKARFASGKLKQKIAEKLKVLRTVIDYQKTFIINEPIPMPVK